MDFSDALNRIKNGYKVSRIGWNGKGMFLFHVDAYAWSMSWGEETYPLLPFIAMKTAGGSVVPWLASQTDILADDWGII